MEQIAWITRGFDLCQAGIVVALRRNFRLALYSLCARPDQDMIVRTAWPDPAATQIGGKSAEVFREGSIELDAPSHELGVSGVQ
jgi:hypothetical protein